MVEKKEVVKKPAKKAKVKAVKKPVKKPVEKVIEKPITEKINLDNGEFIEFVEILVKDVKSGTYKWDEKGTILTSDKVTITFPGQISQGEIVLEMTEEYKKFYDDTLYKFNLKIDDKAIEQSVFKGTSTTYIKSGDFLTLGNNRLVFNEFNEYFKSMGFEKVNYDYNKTLDMGGDCYDNLTLKFVPSIYGIESHVINFPSDIKFPSTVKCSSEFGKLRAEDNETISELKINGEVMGFYYKERNLVIAFPYFFNANLSEIGKIEDDEYTKTITKLFKESVMSLKVKKFNNKKFKMAILVRSFNSGIKSKIEKLYANIEDWSQNIDSAEQNISQYYTKKEADLQELTVLKKMSNNNVDDFIDSINAVKKHPIVKDIKMENGQVSITFIPTTISTELSRSIDGSSTEKIELFIGSITAHIKGDGTVTVTCDHETLDRYPHPHGKNSSKAPCFGSGESPKVMRKLLATRNFEGWIYPFWMWVRSYNPSDCYVSPEVYFDDRLKQGLPVFIEGVKQKFNDEEMIKKGLQLKLADVDEKKRLKNEKKYEKVTPTR